MAGKWAYSPDPENENESYIQAWGSGVCDGTGTETSVTFSTENLPDMADTAYLVFLTAQAASVDIAEKVASRATTGFVVLHANGSSAAFSYHVVGKKGPK